MNIIEQVVGRYQFEKFDSNTIKSIEQDIATLNIEGLHSVTIKQDNNRLDCRLKFTSPEYHTLFLLKQNG